MMVNDKKKLTDKEIAIQKKLEDHNVLKLYEIIWFMSHNPIDSSRGSIASQIEISNALEESEAK